MSKKLPVPKKIPGGKLMVASAAFEAVPSIISSVSTIVESNNNRDVRIAAINARSEVEREKIQCDYQDKCNSWAFKSQVMSQAFQSNKISGSQTIEMFKESLK